MLVSALFRGSVAIVINMAGRLAVWGEYKDLLV